MKEKNTPERIVIRSEGARFFCADCRKTYQKCKCKVYLSVDAIKQGKSTPPRYGLGYPGLV